MSVERSCRQIQTCEQTFEGGGFPVTRPFPVPGFREWDPFLLLDHLGPVCWKPGEALGAPDHPHRGFEAITYLLQGQMIHRDSGGHEAVIGPGDAQWMTAGSGVVHSELPHPDLLRQGGWLEGFQLWINLQAKSKMVPPAYHEIPSAKIPKKQLERGWVNIIAGNYDEIQGPAHPETSIEYRHYHLETGAEIHESIAEGLGLGLYLFCGEGAFGREKRVVQAPNWVAFAEEGESVSIYNLGAESLEFLWLAGRPLGEPIFRHGPFVMNSELQILKALQDFRQGKMGRIEPRVD